LLAALLIVDSASVFKVAVAPAESLSVSVAGQGNPIVLIPGLFGSAFGFRRVVPPLVEAGYQVLVVEPLGVGGSTRPRQADYSLTAQAARVAAVLDSLAIDSAVVVAHSIGGSIAFRLALQRPDLVAGIVSIEGGPAEEAATPGFRLAMRFSRLLRMGGVRLLRGELHRNLKASSGDDLWVTDEVVDGYTADAGRDLGATFEAFKGMADAREPSALAPALARISCPVRLLLGTASHKSGVPPEQVTLLRESLPAFVVDSVPGVGHFIFEEAPQAVVDAVLRMGLESAR
jgi:pimeloyl-ACP methyl ester carboxylesterase